MLVSLLFAWLAVRRYLPGDGLLSALGLSLLLPIVILSWVTFVFGIGAHPTLVVKLIIGLLLGVTALSLRKAKLEDNNRLFQHTAYQLLQRFRQSRVIWLSLAILVPLFAVLLFTHSAQVKNGAWYSAGSSWGDLPLHLTYIHYFARQEQISLVSPLYAQTNTTYPFLFDWYTSLLVRLGASAQTALIISQGQTLLAVILLSLALIRKLDKRPLVTLITLSLFSAGGGLGWWYFWGDWQTAGVPLLTFLQQLPWQYANMPERKVFFSNVVTDMLLPQRGFVVGLAVVIASSWLYLQFLSSKKGRYLLLAGMLVGLLPLFHFHSFLWLTGLWLVLSAFYYWQQPRQRKALVKATAILTCLSLPQIWWFLTNGVGGNFLSWQPGWMLTENAQPPLIEFARLFLLNFGLAAVVCLYLPTRLKQLAQRNAALAILLGYSWLVFIVCLLISFQPWTYDNLKLMMLSYFFFCLFVGMQLTSWWRGWGKLFVVLLLVAGSASGGLSLIREVFLSNEVASVHDLAVAKQLQATLVPGAITLTADNHNHPVPMLVGQPIVLGYGGWLWSHGINASEMASAVAQIYAGSARTTDLLLKYNVRYVYISDRERTTLAVNEPFWAEHYSLIYQENDVLVYQVGER